MKNSNSGFTVIELLAVMTIILVIAGISVAGFQSWRTHSKIKKAKAVISQIEMALEMYKADNGWYPGEEDLNNPNDPKLIDYLSGYVRFDPEDMGSGIPPERDPNGDILLDPWGNEYIVLVDHDANPNNNAVNHWRNRSGCYIYSYGPDGAVGANFNDSENADNIDNFYNK